MRLVLATIILIGAAVVAIAQGTGNSDARVKCLGDWCIVLAAHPNDEKTGLWLRVIASHKTLAVTSVVIASGKPILESCTRDLCEYLWPKSAMSATEDYTITATAANGTKFTMLGKIARP